VGFEPLAGAQWHAPLKAEDGKSTRLTPMPVTFAG
jgi:hypothetical protein